MSAPHVTLNLTDLSALAGWGDGDQHSDAASVVVNALTSLERRLFVLAEYAHGQDDEHLSGVLHCEATRLGSLSVLLAKMLREHQGEEPESEPGVPGSPFTEDRLKLATTAQMKFMRAISAHHGLPMLFDDWLGELRQLTSSCEVDGPEVDATTTTGAS